MVVQKKIISENTLGCAAVNTYFKTRLLSHAPGSKINIFRIPAPGIYFIPATVKSDLLNISAANWHYVYIRVSILPAGKSDPFPVGRNPRTRFISLHRGQPRSLSGLCVCLPQITFETKNCSLAVRRETRTGKKMGVVVLCRY